MTKRKAKAGELFSFIRDELDPKAVNAYLRLLVDTNNDHEKKYKRSQSDLERRNRQCEQLREYNHFLRASYQADLDKALEVIHEYHRLSKGVYERTYEKSNSAYNALLDSTRECDEASKLCDTAKVDHEDAKAFYDNLYDEYIEMNNSHKEFHNTYRSMFDNAKKVLEEVKFNMDSLEDDYRAAVDIMNEVEARKREDEAKLYAISSCLNDTKDVYYKSEKMLKSYRQEHKRINRKINSEKVA